MTAQQLIELLDTASPETAIGALREKSLTLPPWGGNEGLRAQYDPALHPVMDKALYPDIVTPEGVTRVTRVTYDMQRLAVRRMTELVTGIPVKRIYSPANDRQQEAADLIERIFTRARIDSVNTDRFTQLFASCEVMTLWYAVAEPNSLYGRQSPVKVRCRTFSPMQGDELYPLFDEYGDLIALSVGYRRKVGGNTVDYFDAYTADRHIKWSGEDGWRVEEDERITLGKIPAVYAYRPTPIWEDTSRIVYEMEWAMSRNGNYIRENSKPLFVVYADEDISYGQELRPEQEFKGILQYPKGSSAQYVTWPQAVDNLKFHVTELRQSFFTQLQLPDWSYESMKATPMSGESRKQLFIDAQLKVKDESGRIMEMLDREVNVVKCFARAILGESYAADIDALQVETEIKPFTITDEADTISNLVQANGGKPIISQRESVEALGWSSDVDKTMQELAAEEADHNLPLAE